MTQLIAPAIMFLVTVGVVALFVLPMRRWRPDSAIVRFYWKGVWMFLIAITAVAGGMNTLLLLGIDAVEVTQFCLNVLLPSFVGFVVLGWFHMVGFGLIKAARLAVRRS